MDSYVDQFQSHGGSLIVLAKGNRSRQVTQACAKYGGFYLLYRRPAARLAQDCIKSVEIIEYPELGMEAIWKITKISQPLLLLMIRAMIFFK